jgi:hypothetical protein
MTGFKSPFRKGIGLRELECCEQGKPNNKLLHTSLLIELIMNV